MARMPAPTPDLEIEDPDGDPFGSNRRPRPALTGVQLSVIVVVAGALLAVAFPLRAQVNRSEAGRLQRRWAAMVALDQARSADLTSLTRAGAPGDAVEIHATAGTLYDQQAAEVATLRRGLHNDVIVDPGLRRLRGAMARALALEAADLSNAATLWRAAPLGVTPTYLDRRPATSAAIAGAGRLLAVQATRFSLPALRQKSVPHFQAADATIASLKRFLDQPTGVNLLADTSAGLQTIDIDHSVIRPAPVAGLPAGINNIVVARPDFLVFQHPAGAGSRSSFSVAPADLHGPAVAIGSGGQVVAGSTSGTFWLVDLDDTAVEVDRGGATLTAPVALPPNRFVVGATAAGLVLQPHLQSDLSQVPEPIELWDPLRQALVRQITDLGLGVVAADASTIAWVSASDQIHLTDVASGADRTVATPGYIQELVGAAFSPDGSRLATTMRSPDGSHTVPAVVEVASGVARIGESDEFPPEQPGPIAWTASGDRMFVPMSSATPTDQVLTYRPGDGAPHYLRLPDTDRINVFAVVPINSG